MSRKLNTIHNTVLLVLKEDEQARKDDVYLYARVCKHLGIPSDNFYKVLFKHKEYGLPTPESVTRTRRKVQEMHPELVDKNARRKRKASEDVFRDYALNKKAA